MSSVPEEIERLVERFDRNIDAYKSSEYNETELRVELVNPFWKALGWDVDNTQGHALAYRDVIHEATVKVGGATKAPDYSFRIGGMRKFFVETKRPAVNLRDNPGPALQLRRYGWSAKLPLSVLTDFEEMSVYDCRIRPLGRDRASKARINYITYDEYIDRWDEIASVFSRDAIVQGAFDIYTESTRGRRGTTEVDSEFLKDMERWREALAKNLAARNKRLDVHQLNFAVQMTIDRIIFLRMCEDRDMEAFGQLQGLCAGPRIYRRLVEIYRNADEKYNSGLFHFVDEKGRNSAPDTLTPKLKIDDKVLKRILSTLYPPESSYEFSILPPEILGHAYEQFLGKVIRLTPARRVKVEEKPEVRKAGGVYYTPQYIVGYIVKQTVGRLCEGKTPKEVEQLRILDPACGSGSFLLGAYQFLLDWHLQAYLTEYERTGKTASRLYDTGWGRKRKRSPVLYYGKGGEWFLTTAEKKRILLDNIHGVDIDEQAVEVTKLSLLLKVLENETQRTLIHERALPDLSDNIKCGNSLIGPDFYDVPEQMEIFEYEDETRRRINAFDWHDPKHGFGAIMKAGGFDAVIGNPPYVRVRFFKTLCPEEAVHFERTYTCATHVWDLYLLFFERAIELARSGGYTSFIVPIQTLHQPNCESLRSLLLSRTLIHTVTDLSALRVFSSATVKNCIIVCQKGHKPKSAIQVSRPSMPTGLREAEGWFWPQGAARNNPGQSLKVELLSPSRDLCESLLSQSWRLGEICYCTFGLRSCAKGRGQGGKERLITDNPKARHAMPYLEGRDIGRYQMRPTGRFIRYIPSEMYSPRSPELFERRKLVTQSMLSKKRLVATLDVKNHYVEQSLVCIIPHGLLTSVEPPIVIDLAAILGVLLSRLQSYFFGTYIIDYSLGGGLIHATPGSYDKLLVPRSLLDYEDRIVSLVETMLALNKKLPQAKTPNARTRLERDIAATDRRIDALVYELYGLTEEEIQIVEGEN